MVLIVAATQHKLAQRPEMTLNPIEPRCVCRSVDQFHIVLDRPVSDTLMLVRRKVVQDDVQPLGTVITTA